MFGISDKGTPNGIEQIRGDAGITEKIVNEKKKTLILIIGIGVDTCIRIIRFSITIQTSPSLTVFENDYLPPETIGMIQEALDQAPDEIAVGAPTVFPLGIHLDQNDIVGSDHPRRPAQNRALEGAVKLQSVFSHQVKEGIYP
jgi:hypothetical protein